MIVADNGALGLGMDKGADVERDAHVLEGLDGLGVDDRSAIVGQLDGLVVGYLVDFNRVREKLRVGVEETRHILPDGNAFGPKAVGQDGGAVVGAFATQGGGGRKVGIEDGELVTVALLLRTSDEPLSDNHLDGFLAPVGYSGIDSLLGGCPVDTPFAEMAVRDDHLSGIDPLSADSMMVKTMGDDGGGEQLAEGDHLVVVEIVELRRGVQLGHGLVELAQQRLNLADKLFIVWNQTVGDAEMIVFQLLAKFADGRGILGPGTGNEFLQQVGRLAHGGDHHHQRL